MYRPDTRSLAATALAVVATAGATAPAADAGTRARPADSFVESVGVNVHLGYTQSPYKRYDVVQEKLQKLGVRYVRDGLNPGQTQVYRAWRGLAKCGIKVNLIVGDPLQRWGIGPLASQLALIKKAEITDAIASLEGPNEYDNQGDRRWQSTLRRYQQRLYEGVKSDPELKRFPVLGPSFVKRESRAQLGDISGSLDYGNMHPYPGGEAPDREEHMRSELALAANNSRSKPVQATETGYHNGLGSPSSHKPTSERAAGVYMPRLFLDYFRRGITRTYSYELIDQRPAGDKGDLEANFGLLRYDYSEKPAFKAISRMNKLLADPGPSFRTSSLDYSIKNAPAGLRQVLLQKRDGSFYLALWRDESVWNTAANKTARAAASPVRVVLPGRARQVQVFRPEPGRQRASLAGQRPVDPCRGLLQRGHRQDQPLDRRQWGHVPLRQHGDHHQGRGRAARALRGRGPACLRRDRRGRRRQHGRHRRAGSEPGLPGDRERLAGLRPPAQRRRGRRRARLDPVRGRRRGAGRRPGLRPPELAGCARASPPRRPTPSAAWATSWAAGWRPGPNGWSASTTAGAAG